MIARGFAVGVMALALASCQAGTFRSFDLDADGSSHSIDASQRLLLVTSRGGTSGNKRVVCAEPSPDSLASIAASAAVNGQATLAAPTGTTAANGRLSAGAAFAENAAYTGMRTQTVQLLRDGLYRACEAYMNGAIDESQYNILLVNMSQLMVALTAIDGLTGRPSAPAVILSSGGATTTLGADGKIETATGKSEISDAIKVPGAVDGKSAEAVARIVENMTKHSTFPAMCLSLMAATHDPDKKGGSQEFAQVRRLCSNIFARLPSSINYH